MNIRVDLTTTIKDGTEVVFRSPVDCSQVTGLIVYYNENGNTVSKEFAFADAHGNDVGDIDHLFAENVVVKVILDLDTSMAFVQNADTNAYLEGRFAELEERIGSGEGHLLVALNSNLTPVRDDYLTTITEAYEMGKTIVVAVNDFFGFSNYYYFSEKITDEGIDFGYVFKGSGRDFDTIIVWDNGKIETKQPEQEVFIVKLCYDGNALAFDGDYDVGDIYNAYDNNILIEVVAPKGEDGMNRRYYFQEAIPESYDDGEIRDMIFVFACNTEECVDTIRISTQGYIERSVNYSRSGQTVEIIRVPYEYGKFLADDNYPGQVLLAINEGKLPVIVSNTKLWEPEIDQYYYFVGQNSDGDLVFRHDGETETNTIRIDDIGDIHLDRQFKDFRWLGTLRFDGSMDRGELDSMEGLGYVGEFSEFYIRAVLPPRTDVSTSGWKQLYFGHKMWSWDCFMASAFSDTATQRYRIHFREACEGRWATDVVKISGTAQGDNAVYASANTFGNIVSTAGTAYKISKLYFYTKGAFPEGTEIEVYGR